MNEIALYVLVALGFVVVAVWASYGIVWEFDLTRQDDPEREG